MRIPMAKTKVIQTTGSRKHAVARATLVPGTGKIRINNQLLDIYEPEIARLRIQEPLILAGDIAKALVEFAGRTSKLKEQYLAYDRQLLVADVRYKETCKPNDSKARAKRQKSYR